MTNGQAGEKRQPEAPTLAANQINEAGKKWLQQLAETRGDKTLKQLTEEQLDAVSGGSPSLWDILGDAIQDITGPIGNGGPCPTGMVSDLPIVHADGKVGRDSCI
jgi:hypothetical protein